MLIPKDPEQLKIMNIEQVYAQEYSGTFPLIQRHSMYADVPCKTFPVEHKTTTLN